MGTLVIWNPHVSLLVKDKKEKKKKKGTHSVHTCSLSSISLFVFLLFLSHSSNSSFALFEFLSHPLYSPCESAIITLSAILEFVVFNTDQRDDKYDLKSKSKSKFTFQTGGKEYFIHKNLGNSLQNIYYRINTFYKFKDNLPAQKL